MAIYGLVSGEEDGPALLEGLDAGVQVGVVLGRGVFGGVKAEAARPEDVADGRLPGGRVGDPVLLAELVLLPDGVL
ncbi:MAG: hypothetical protein M3Q03_18650 [Chloroflexota bacterium]|nr:hypothetical protein [Chloroflexota bacterium]